MSLPNPRIISEPGPTATTGRTVGMSISATADTVVRLQIRITRSGPKVTATGWPSRTVHATALTAPVWADEGGAFDPGHQIPHPYQFVHARNRGQCCLVRQAEAGRAARAALPELPTH